VFCVVLLLFAAVCAVGDEPAAQVPTGGAGASPPEPAPADPGLARAAQELQELGQQQAKAQDANRPEVDRLKAQLDLQQKQIDVLQKMTRLLADRLKEQSAAAPGIEALEDQTSALESSARQAAQRNLEQARANDKLIEELDLLKRRGPSLPATLREIFSPTRNNQSPLVFYGLLDQDFHTFSKQNSTFQPPTFQVHPYLQLNEKWLMSANIIFLSNSLQICRMQAEYFLNDNLTVVAGRFYSPIGFYSERLRLSWVIKTPDNPLMFNQVYPDNLYFDGLQLRGAKYLFRSPVKLEYAGFVANGLSVQGSNPSVRVYSDLSNFTDSGVDVNSAKAWGGRVGLSVPTIGFIAGLSGLANQSYDSANQSLSLWDVDANWHKGNWDARFELAKMDQQAPGNAPNIHRFGYYAQVAYRQYNNPSPILRKLEGVFRFDHTQFDGINLAQTGINFGGYAYPYARMPLDRNRYTIGLNYWFYPSLGLKLAFEKYEELGVPSLRDDGFICQLAWGF
jgi:hypothetical protein